MRRSRRALNRWERVAVEGALTDDRGERAGIVVVCYTGIECNGIVVLAGCGDIVAPAVAHRDICGAGLSTSALIK